MPNPDLPLVLELPPGSEPARWLPRLARLRHPLFLDSALRHPVLGRYSFLAADPFDWIELPPQHKQTAPQPFARLAAQLACCRQERVASLPPFQGGAAGLFSYDLNRSLERIAAPRWDEFQLPAVAVGLYDVVVAFDHRTGRGWIISQGFPETNPEARRDRAAARLAEFREYLFGDATLSLERANEIDSILPLDELVPSYPTPGAGEVRSTFNRADYLAAVGRAIDYIYAGDLFQVNLAQRLLHPAVDDPVSLYLRLRARNPAPFSAYFDGGTFQLASASPERFLRVADRQVETRPIKGTRPRLRRPEADLYSGDELRHSEKDRAENLMIVDLLRNDLSRACTAESVRVTQLCAIEEYQFVQHLVSVVEGTLRPDCTPLDMAAAAFPGGSITGAPKVRAMEVIAELEPTARGAYCGSLGYIGFDGSMDLNILIRTITAARGWWQFPVGGGIVAQSAPEREYEETWDKAQGLLRSLLP